MRLLYLNHNVIWRSTFYRCLAYGREMVRRGHLVTLLTIHPSARLGFRRSTIDGVEVVETPDLTRGMARSGWDPWDTAARLWLVRQLDYDLVHAFDSRPAVILPALYARWRRRVPLVLDWADWWGRGGIIAERRSFFLRRVFAPVETWFEEAFRARADALTVISTALGDRARRMGIPGGRIHRLPGGVDPLAWTPRPAGAARSRLGLPAAAPLVLFSGFVHYDIDLVLATFAEVHRRRPAARLVLTGQSGPGLASRLAGLGLGEAVIDRGTVPAEQVPDYVAAADVCLVPFADKVANRGRWPNKAGDYLSMGRAVVSNPVGDVAELLGRSGAGLLAEPNAPAMAAAVLRLLDEPSERERLGRRAREVAVDQLDYGRLSAPLEALYRSLRRG